jgi:hypothetical protein
VDKTTGDVASATIDQGIGTVSGTTESPLSGTVTVSPIKDTTYTASYTYGCTTYTASVTVGVLGVPPLPSAILWLNPSSGIASAKTATLPQSAKVQLISTDLDRRTHSKQVACRFNIVEEVRTPRNKNVNCRFDIRAPKRKSVPCRFDIEVPTPQSKVGLCRFNIYATRNKLVACRFNILYPDRMHVFIRNTATGVVTELGAIDADAAIQALTDVAISPGTYEIWTERESTFWKGCRASRPQVVTIADGVDPQTDPLPGVINLAASVSRGVTTLTWDVAHAIPRYGLDFGLWYSSTSPVDTSGEPDALVESSKARTSYTTTHRQTAAEYVAVALVDEEGTLGPVAELSLPWSTSTPSSPVNQTVNG